MKRLRWWTFALILLLAVFFNIDQLPVEPSVILNADMLPHVLLVAAVLATIAIPRLSELPLAATVVGWAAAYLVGHLVLMPQVWLFGTGRIYVTVVEITVLALAVVVATQVARALREFVRAVEQLTIPDAERWVLDLKHAADAISTEVNRSRRYQRPLSVLVVEPRLDTVRFTLERLFAEVQRGIARHYAIVNLGRMLRVTLRRTDVITLEDRLRGRFIVLCPETTVDGATTLRDRIQDFAPQELGFTVECGTGIFPDDALTFEDVVRIAASRVGQPTNPDSIPLPERTTQDEPGITT